MRIQHNIMAMNAYRNYTNNTSAMQKNLERLSSGYKINRAGDDAAGLAISEKMRAQITGLQVASKNAKDGISLVQTAEGALTEVHDMLNRMVELATMSANGTYAGDTDRGQLQKELDQLKEEIDRIADSANFNGIKLLDGSMDASNAIYTGMNRILQTIGTGIENIGKVTILDTEGTADPKKTVFSVDFSALSAGKIDKPETPEGGGGTTSKGTIEAGEPSITAVGGDETTIGSGTGISSKVDGGTTSDQFAWAATSGEGSPGDVAKARLAALIEAADGYLEEDTTGGVDIKLAYDGSAKNSDGEDGKWTLTVGNNIEIEVKADFTMTGNGELTITDLDGNALFTITAGDDVSSTQSNLGAVETAFKDVTNGYGKSGGQTLGINYTAPTANTVNDGSNDIMIQYTAGDGLLDALAAAAKAAAADEDAPFDFDFGSADGEAIKVEYKASNGGPNGDENDVWEITLFDGTNTLTLYATGALNTAGDTLTLSDEEGNELLSIKFGSNANLAGLKTNGFGGGAAVETNLTYTAAAVSDSVSINGAPADITYEATEALVDALGDSLKDGDQIVVEYDDSGEEPVWKIYGSSDTTGENALVISAENAKFDVAKGTMTFFDEDGETALLTISIEAGSATEEQFIDGFKTAGPVTTNLTYTAGTGEPEPDPEPETEKNGLSFTIGGITVEGVEIEEGATAADIAQAIFDKLGEEGSEYNISEEDGVVQVELTHKDGTKAKYTVDYEAGSTKLTFTLAEDEVTKENVSGNFDWDVSVDGGSLEGTHNAGTIVETPGAVKDSPQYANTVFEIKKSDLKDGTTITFAGKTVTLAIGPETKYKNAAGAVILTEAEAENLDQALSKIVEKLGSQIGDFYIGVNNTGNDDVHAGIAVASRRPDDPDKVGMYTEKADLAKLFSISVPKDENDNAGLTLQIGDTAESYNQLKVSIKDCHTDSMVYTDDDGNEISIADIRIDSQDDAADAVNVIKNAINYVSDVRGTLGATQNRLDHTINNLSVMTENITDAESTIRDTDIAEEMMSYTKNNILIQAAQAMLAQANQVPQGVLQLLQ